MFTFSYCYFYSILRSHNFSWTTSCQIHCFSLLLLRPSNELVASCYPLQHPHVSLASKNNHLLVFSNEQNDDLTGFTFFLGVFPLVNVSVAADLRDASSVQSLNFLTELPSPSPLPMDRSYFLTLLNCSSFFFFWLELAIGHCKHFYYILLILCMCEGICAMAWVAV